MKMLTGTKPFGITFALNNVPAPRSSLKEPIMVKAIVNPIPIPIPSKSDKKGP